MYSYSVRSRLNSNIRFIDYFSGAALLIGLWDLLVHSVVLCALIFMFRQQPKLMNDLVIRNDPSFQPRQVPLDESLHSEQPSNMIMHNKNFLSSNILLNRILEKHNVSHVPMGLNSRNFYSNLDLMTIKWASSLNRRM